MNTRLVRSRPAAALVATAALAGGLLGTVTPAQADDVVTHTVTVQLDPVQPDWNVDLSCSAPSPIIMNSSPGPGSGYQDRGQSDGAGRVVFAGVPDGLQCSAVAYPGKSPLDFVYGHPAGEYVLGSGYTSSAVTEDVSLPVTLTANPFMRCTSASTLSGIPAVGQTLTAGAPTFAGGSGQGATDVRYDWYRLSLVNGHLVQKLVQSGGRASNKAAYTLTEADYGHQMMAEVSGADAGGNGFGFIGLGRYRAVCDYNPSAVVGRLGTPTAGNPAIRGHAAVGKRMFASAPQVPGSQITGYQWYVQQIVGGHGRASRVVLRPIKNATRWSYRVKARDLGKRILVGVTYSRASFEPTRVLSKARKIRH